MLIAVDGPAASGKGTIAKRLAERFDLPHLDSGLLYRAVGYLMMQSGADLSDAARAAEIAKALDLAAIPAASLRTREAGTAASLVSVHPEVRAALLAYQRRFAAQDGGAVLDGRDMGTVIAPNADVKIFVTADLKVRAKRRYDELIGRGETVELSEIEADLAARDARDRDREASPLKVADGAFVIDTSNLDIEQSVAAALDAVEAATG